MIDSAAVVTAAETGATALDLTGKGWNFLHRRLHGRLEITSHKHNVIANPGWVPVGGVFQNAQGFLWFQARQEVFWVLTRAGNKHWPQCRLEIRSDGTWASKIHVNDDPGPRHTTVLLVWASQFLDEIFRDYKAAGVRRVTRTALK